MDTELFQAVLTAIHEDNLFFVHPFCDISAVLDGECTAPYEFEADGAVMITVSNVGDAPFRLRPSIPSKNVLWDQVIPAGQTWGYSCDDVGWLVIEPEGVARYRVVILKPKGE